MSHLPATHPSLYSALPRRRRSAAALIIVLSLVVLITVMVVGLLQRAGSERISAANYKATAGTRQLADTAINLVQGQVNQATSKGSSYAWASQPGAIRLFKNDGSLDTVYRLYSAPMLTTTKASDLGSDLPAAADTSWQTKSSPIWVDINAPAISATGALSYPIVDARDPVNPNNIINMDGFAVTGTGAMAATANQKAPMPVRWLYVLQDGQIQTSASVLPNATTVTVTGASAANPIVGRIAFWTDDETCKVNINTAGGDGIVTNAGDYSDIATKAFWDTPRYSAPDEFAMASKQPTSSEYQRYPGHPATVSMNNILNGLGLTLASSDFYKLTPRYANGGSLGATQTCSSAVAPVIPSSRLYASVSELLFDPARNPSVVNNATTARQRMETARFFLTAHSRAPEVNLFGKPRVSIWPISSTDDSNHRTAVDRLIAFDSTVGSLPYYFSRQSATSATADVGIQRNADLLKYLDNLTGQTIPGFGGSFNAKYGQLGTRQILTEIFDYIRIINLKDPNLPGATGSNGSKFYNNPNWYATELESGYNYGLGQVTPTNYAAWGTQGFGSFPRVAEVVFQFVGLGDGKNGAAAAVPVPTAQFNYGEIKHDPAIAASGTPPDGTRAVMAYVLVNFNCPAQMMTRANSLFWVEVDDLDQFTLEGTSLGFPSKTAMLVGANMSGGPIGGDQGTGYLGFVSMTGCGGANRNFMQPTQGLTGTSPLALYRSGDSNTLYSMIIPVPIRADQKMDFKGDPARKGIITVKTYAPNRAGLKTSVGDLVQTVQVTVPDTTFDLPKLTTYPEIGNGKPTDRWQLSMGASNVMIDAAADVVQSLVLNTAQGWGDSRMLATSAVVSNAFVPHPAWGTGAMAHSSFFSLYGMQRAHGGNKCGAAPWGRLVNGATYPVESNNIDSWYPVAPPTLNGATIAGTGIPGDWDNGCGPIYIDGPWINKTDEGGMPNAGVTPYFDASAFWYTLQAGFFSPNRQVPSPVVFGSLPTGVDPKGISPKPWQTLLFRPAPGHPGEGYPSGGLPYSKPPDHLLLDLFWMPVAEPYAISEPFSTAGKVNLNYQIVPFTYITRSTALRAVMASEKVAQVTKASAQNYKAFSGIKMGGSTRYSLNLNETLKQCDAKFSQWDIYRSASQICELYLVPDNQTLASFTSAWYGDNYAMVGDNVREKPYADIYGRIATKSNTFTVYFTVQVLNNKASTTPSQWDETKGAIMGEYRGSTTLERFIDPSASIPDYSSAAASAPILESFYKWRVVSNHQFVP